MRPPLMSSLKATNVVLQEAASHLETSLELESCKKVAKKLNDIEKQNQKMQVNAPPAVRKDILDFCRIDHNELDRHGESEVAAFYKNRSIFITGASGFVGKCLLEKLLRSCPDLAHVYILMRPKRGVEVKERTEILKKSELFDRLRKSSEGSKQLDKVTPIEGDITKPLFGLSSEDVDRLSQQVSLVFHSAATVKFVEPLSVAVGNNVVSVENLIDFASKLGKLEALVHVSTAYSNCDREQVDEIFYDAPIDANKLIDMAKWMEPEMFEKISPVLLGGRPNTYTYTKAVAESLLVEKSKLLLPTLPIAMVRPSIVAGIWRQPIRGWVDNFNGPTGVILSMMTGAIQAMLACPKFCADIVPVDIVANLIICAAKEVHEQHRTQNSDREKKRKENNSLSTPSGMRSKQNENISIFNCVSGTLNPVAWEMVAGRVREMATQYPCNTLMRRPGFLLLANEHLFDIYNFFNHTLIAYGGDFFLKIIGKKPTLVLIYKRLMKMVTTLKPFTTNQWLFKCTNVTSLYERLSPIDQNLFNFDVRQVTWSDYLDRYYVGSKIYVLKDDPSKLPTARHKLQRMNNGSRLAQIVFLLIAYYFLMSGTQTEKYVMQALGQIFTFDQVDGGGGGSGLAIEVSKSSAITT